MFRHATGRTAALSSSAARRIRVRGLSGFLLRQIVPPEAGIASYYATKSQRWISSTTVLLRDERKRPSGPHYNGANNKQAAIAINKRLVELGKKQQWDDLLELALKEQRSFNNVNCATLMSQLGRIRSFNKADPRFVGFLEALAGRIEERGLPWIKARQAANIIHAIGKMKLIESEYKETTRVDLEARSSCKLCGGRKSSGSCQHGLGMCNSRC